MLNRFLTLLIPKQYAHTMSTVAWGQFRGLWWEYKRSANDGTV